jgi:hypothetical protein
MIYVCQFNAYPETVFFIWYILNFVHIYTLLYLIGYWCIYYCNTWQEQEIKRGIINTVKV